MAGYDQQGVGGDQLEPVVDRPLPLVLPVGVGDVGEHELALEGEPALLPTPTEHLE